MLSTLCHTIIWPAGRVAGFGENDNAPLMPTTLTVTTPDVLGLDGVGAPGFPLFPLPEPLPLQPHRFKPNATTTPAVTIARMLFLPSFSLLIVPPVHPLERGGDVFRLH